MQEGPRRWDITIHSSLQNLSIISAIFDITHWENFRLLSNNIDKVFSGESNKVLLFKEDIIADHLSPLEDIDVSTIVNSSQTGTILNGVDLCEDPVSQLLLLEFMCD